MIRNIYLVMEALSIVICLHYLYGKKFKFDIATVSLLSIDMIIMQTIDYYGLPNELSLLIYFVIAIYCGVEFGFQFRALIINNILYFAIISSIQFIILLFYYFISRVMFLDDMGLLIVNTIAFMVVLFILPKCRLDKIAVYFQDKERIYVISLFISIAATGYWLIKYKKTDSVGVFQSILLFAIIIFICFLVIQLGKYKIRAKEIETELKMHKLYADSFQNLIDNIRLRQHEFNNHINTIYSMHYMFNTYEGLVNAQKEYYKAVDKDNRYYKLLTAGNPVIMGFLYGKFVEIDKLGIDISYQISIDDFNVGVPIYKIVEILGNLIKNAVEALQEREEDKCLFVSMIEKDGIFGIEVRNISDNIELEEISKFFVKGYSKKGKSRGLGLYNVKSICQEYELDIRPEIKNIDDKEWLSFVITNKKETR